MENGRNTKTRSAAVFCFFLFLLLIKGYGAQVLYIDITDEPIGSYKIIEATCRFYGLETDKLILKQESLQDIKASVFEKDELKAVVMSADSFKSIEEKVLFSMLIHLQNLGIPLIITEVSLDTDSKLLQNLSNNKILGMARANNLSAQSIKKISELKTYAHQMAGFESAFANEELNYFRLDDPIGVESIIYITNERCEDFFPVFVRISVKGQEIFFLTRGQISESSSFSKSILPVMMFLRHACSTYCWHSSNHFANFMVDDPWLTESYGHFNYKKLCNDNDEIFHTTIGFIPWNFDRSEQNVVKIFKEYPYKLSLCIHGNNHDHYEFYKYETDSSDPWPAKPLNVQEYNIKQALARMEKHKELTGLDYDRVLVFPHGIAPEKTLGLLKKYNFLATVNADNVPLGADKPKDPFFDLRAVTLEFENFPSFRRYTPSRSEFEIALDLFLDNPLLFYAHHDYFKKGMESFNETAEMVNRLEPDIQWRSLGYIAKHYYLERLREDGNYDVKAFTNHFIVKNHHEKDLIYYIQQSENFSIPIRQVTVNGDSCAYKEADEKLILTIDIPEGESCEVFIEYENDLDVESIDIAKDDPRINKLRKISDFRDITLSQNFFGRFIISIYYDTGLYKWGMKKIIVVFALIVIFAGLALGGFIYYRRKKKKS